MSMQPNWTKMMSLGLIKMPGVHWTEKEREYVFSGPNGGVRMDRAEELRVAYIAEGRGEKTQVIAHAVAKQETKDKEEADAVKKETMDKKEEKKEDKPLEDNSLTSKKKRYEKLSGKKAVGKYGNDAEWLDKKIKELTA